MNNMLRGALARFALALAALAANPALAAGSQLLTPWTGPVPKASIPGVHSPGTPVRFNAEPMLALAYGDEAEFTLPNGHTHAYVFELAKAHGGGIATWIGKSRSLGNAYRAIVTSGPGGSFGVFSTPEGDFRLVPGEGHDWLVDMTEEQPHIPVTTLENDAIPVPPQAKRLEERTFEPLATVAIPGVNTVGVSKVTPAPQYVVDLMFVYTQGFATKLGVNLATRLNFLVERANTSYADSEIAITLRLVGSMQVSYSDATSGSTALYNATPACTAGNPSCGALFDSATFSGVETMRTNVGADVVAVLRDGGSFSGSGIAWVGSSSPNALYMYSVTTGCTNGCESVFIHEVGHNMGNMHDRATSSWQAGGTPTPPTGAFSYSYGYAFCKSGALSCNPTIPPGSGGCASNTQPECSTNDANSFSDLMAYFHGTTERQYQFSNPGVNCIASINTDGIARPCGVNELAANSANTALSMNNNRAALSAIKPTMISLSTIEFSTPTLSVGESGANGFLTLTRTGDPSTPASVTYTTASGSATSGSDFVQNSGTVSWAASDGAPKTIAVGPTAAGAPYIQVLDDSTIEPSETFTVVLSAPTGGAQLGAASTATVTITDNDQGFAMAAAAQGVAENAGNALVSVQRLGPSSGAVSVNYATSNGTAIAGTHYTATSGTLNWADGDATPKTITVPLIDDSAVNAARTFTVTLSGVNVGSPSQTTVTVNDDDNAVQFTSAAATVSEGSPFLTLSVSRVGAISAPAQVAWITVDGSALAGTDFGASGDTTPVFGVLSWGAGDGATKTLTIPILNDALLEPTKSFFVGLGSPVGTTVGATNAVSVTLLDDESAVSFASPGYNVGESGMNISVQVNRTGNTAQAIGVTWTTANGTAVAGQDFGTTGNPAQKTGTLSWPAGDATPRTITVGPFLLATVGVVNDALFEGPESFTIALSNPTGGALLGATSVTTVTIDDDESVIEFSPPALGVGETGANGALTLTRTGALTNAVTVTWTTANGTATAGSDFGTSGSATQRTGTVSWAAGDGSPKTLTVGPTGTIPVLNDTAIEGPETFAVVLSAPTGGGLLGTASAATVTITSEDQGIAMAAGAQSVAEGAGSALVSVQRVGTPNGAVSVNYATANGTALAGTHYTATSGTLNWADGDGAPKAITVPLIDDAAVNAARTFAVNLSGAVGATLGSPAMTTVTVTDDDNTVQFTAATATVTEGTANLVVTVSRVGATGAPAQVAWTTVDATALAGTDFGALGNATPVSGILAWGAGDGASKTITIPILNDAIVEAAKTFFIGLGAPTGTAVGSPNAVTVTLNDDDAGLSFGAPSYSVTENGPMVNVTVNRTGAATGAVSVTWTTANGTAVAGSDFGTAGNAAQRTGTLSWLSGDSAAKTISVGGLFSLVPVINDAVVEPDKTFTITLSNPTGGAQIGGSPTASVTIVDDDNNVQFSPAALAVGEAGPNGALTLVRTGGIGAAASVTWTTASGTAVAGSDFTQSTGTVSWAAGDGSPKMITVGPAASPAPYIPVLNDALVEGPEAFTVTLSSPVGTTLGAATTATVTITSDDQGIAMASATQGVLESAGSAVISVQRLGPPTGAVSVNYATANGSAIAGTHYTAASGTLNWADGDGAAKTIPVTIADDSGVNAARTFTVTLSGPGGGAVLGTPAATTVTIGDDDNTVQFSVPTATIAEGAGNLTLTVTRVGGAAAPATVNWTTADGTALAGTDFGAPGNTAPVSGTLNWGAGDSASKSVVIPIIDDGVVEGAKTFTVNLSGPGGTAVGTPAAVAVTLNDNDAGVVFASATYTVGESGAAVTLTVNRIGPTSGNASVNWTTANGTATAGQDFGTAGLATQRSGTLNWFLGDATPKTIVIPILGDAVSETNETFTVTLSNPSAGIVIGTLGIATVTITDDDAPPRSLLQLEFVKYVVSEAGGSAVLNVTRTLAPGGDFNDAVSVNYATAPGTALAASDYTTRSGTLNWGAGDSASKPITVPITNDAVAESPEIFAVALGSPSTFAGLGPIPTAFVTIEDDDEVFPPGGGIAPGWSIPAAAQGGFSVSNDPGAYEGALQLRSDTVFDNGAAQIEVSGNWLAGTLTFRAKVSSEAAFDALRFYVDGVPVGEWSGTANGAWQLFSMPVAAGAHTFRWSYEKDGSVTMGQDAAWIDAVVLPPPGP